MYDKITTYPKHTLALEMILTATEWPLSSPFFPLAKQVWPKCPRPISLPISYFAPKFFGYPKLLSSPLSPSPPPPAAAPPSSGIGSGPPVSLAGPRRRSIADMIGFAGDGGGSGHLNFLPGVLAGEGATPAGSGLWNGLAAKECKGVAPPAPAATTELAELA